MELSNSTKIKNIATLSVMLGLAIIMGYVEMLIPFSFSIPGVKLGLANLVTMFILFRFGFKEGIMVGIMRVLLTGLLFSNISMLIYSLGGFILSFVLAGLLKKTGIFSIMGISIAAGVMHNITQLAIAYFIMGIARPYTLIYYFPYLLISGALTGAAIGMLTNRLLMVIKEK